VILNNLVRLLRLLVVFLLIFNVWVVDTNAATDSEKANEQIVFNKAKKGIVNKSKVILRFGPGKDRKICCRISDKGTSLKVLGKKDDWYQIKLGRTVAWIEARYMNIIEPEASKDIVTAADQVQVIKTLDNQKKEIEDKIEQKAALEIADLENGKPKGDADSTIIEEDILNEKNKINKADSIDIYTGPGKGFLNKDKVTLRFGPGLDRKICCRLTDKGTSIRVLGKKDNWYQVKVGGTVAWIEADHLTLGEKPIAKAVPVSIAEEKDEKITAIEEKKQESEADKVDMKIPEKEKAVEVASVDIEKKETYDDVIYTGPEVGIVNKEKAILRFGPGKDRKLCCRISEKGKSLKILGKKNDWYQIKLGGTIAWIEAANLTIGEQVIAEIDKPELITETKVEEKEVLIAIEDKQELTEKKKPLEEEVVIKGIPVAVSEMKADEPVKEEKKEMVAVIEKKEVLEKPQAIIEEIVTEEIVKKESTAPEPTVITKRDDIEIFDKPAKGYLNKSRAILRYSPEKDGKLCCRISEKGTRVKILGKKGAWFQVKFGSAVAWIEEAYLNTDIIYAREVKEAEPITIEKKETIADAKKEEKVEPLFEEKEEAEIDEKAVISEEAKPEDIPDLAALEEKMDEDIETGEIVEEDIVEGGKEQVEDVEKVEAVEEDKKETVEAIAEKQEEEPADKGTIEEEMKNAQEDDELVFVKKIEISGNRMIDTGTLEKKVEVYLNKAITFEEMSEIPDAITVAYQEKGYILARAYLPEQEIQDGILKLSIAEGKIGKITVSGRTHYKDRVIKRFFKEQMKHGIVNENILEKGLLLTKQEVKKVKTDVVLKQGEEPGEVDIVLNTDDISTLTLGMDHGIEYNNFGKDNVSKDRYTTNIKIIDHMWGSTTDFKTTMGNIPEDSTLVNVNFSAPINSYGTKYILNYVEGNYALGGSLAELGLAGDSTIWNTEISHPLITRKNMNLTLSFGYGHKYSQMEIEDSGELSIDEIDTFSIILNFDNLDRFLGKNIANLTYLYGDVDPDNEIDPSRTNYTHTFDKLSVYFARIQKLYGYTSLVTSISGQFTTDRLLPMEQLSIGGFGTVRGHEPSLYSGDLGYSFAMELMFAPPYIAEKTIFGNRVAQILQFVFFYEYAEIFNSDHESDEYGSEDLSGYGLGVRFFYKELLTVKYDLGVPVNRKESYPKFIHYLQMTYNFF